MKPRDVLGLGIIAVDDMFYVDAYPAADAKIRVNARRRQGGGNTSCGLAAAARLGSSTSLLGRLGDNELSRFAREHLTVAGVDLSLIQFHPDAEPLYCAIVVSADTGSRAIYADYAAVRPLEPEELREQWFAGAKVLLVDHLQPSTLARALDLAKANRIQVVSDIECDMPELPGLRPLVDHYICSAEFAVPHTGAASAAEACARLRREGRHRTVVVTAGAEGCFWAEGVAVRHLPAHPVHAVDTTGCGDVFHGAFCHGLARGWPTDRTVAFANAAAAVKATRTGGWAAVPRPEEVKQLLRESLAN